MTTITNISKLHAWRNHLHIKKCDEEDKDNGERSFSLSFLSLLHLSFKHVYGKDEVLKLIKEEVMFFEFLLHDK